MSAQKIKQKILIVDDHLLFADGLEMILSQLGKNLQVFISCEPEKALADIDKLKTYDLLLIDLNMPGINGFNFLQAIRAQNLNVKVVAISGTDDRADVERAIQLGASGFIPKDSPTSSMLKGVQEVLAGRRYLPEDWEGEVNWLPCEPDGNSPLLAKIGERQLEVLRMMSDGLQNKEIALVLGVSLSAVKRHVEILFKALNVKNRTMCVQEAAKQNLI